MTQDQFVELLAEWFRANKQTSTDLKITADTELLGSGLLDSFDFRRERHDSRLTRRIDEAL